jgi:hypothetical protein
MTRRRPVSHCFALPLQENSELVPLIGHDHSSNFIHKLCYVYSKDSSGGVGTRSWPVRSLIWLRFLMGEKTSSSARYPDHFHPPLNLSMVELFLHSSVRPQAQEIQPNPHVHAEISVHKRLPAVNGLLQLQLCVPPRLSFMNVSYDS